MRNFDFTLHHAYDHNVRFGALIKLMKVTDLNETMPRSMYALGKEQIRKLY